MKFDVVIMNPPYQTKADEKFDKTKPIWQDFAKLSHDITKENGIIAAIHPSGWRRPTGNFVDTRKLIQSKKIRYLSINGLEKGLEVFKCQTRFDWYIIENTKSDGTITEIDDEAGEKTYLSISSLPFIPNSNFDLVNNLIAKDGEEKVEILHSHSEYEPRKLWMSKVQNDVFKYPCVYSINSKGEVKYQYSSRKGGMFGVPKVIFPSGAFQSVDVLVDKNGDY